MRSHTIMAALDITAETARRVADLVNEDVDARDHPAVIQWAESCYHDPRESRNARPECILVAVNAELGGSGVEGIEGAWVDGYACNIQAAYVNMGDTYTPTILYDNVRERFVLTSCGDWAERHERRLR